MTDYIELEEMLAQLDESIDKLRVYIPDGDEDYCDAIETIKDIFKWVEWQKRKEKIR